MLIKKFCTNLVRKSLTKKALEQSNNLTNIQNVCGCKLRRNYHSGSYDFIFRQFMEQKSYTFSYLLADPISREAIIIDPVVDTVDRDLRVVKDFNLELVHGLNTHVHADHITGTGELKKQLPDFQSVIAANSGARADIKLQDGEFVKFGKFQVQALSTPGHTNGCMTYVWHEKGMVFTGDALLIRGCGRTDFQQGCAATLYNSVHEKIFTLPDNYFVFPAHDYTGHLMSTIGEEKRLNPRLTKSKEEFVKIMGELQLPYPRQIDTALPANLVCGLYD